MRSTEPTNVGKIFVVALYSRKIFSYVFCVRKYFYNENKANYSTFHFDPVLKLGLRMRMMPRAAPVRIAHADKAMRS